VASAAPNAQSDGFFSSLARKVGFGAAADTTASAPIPAKPKVIEAKRNEPPRTEASVPKTAAAAVPKVLDTKQASAARPPLKPSVSDTPPTAPAATAAASPGLVAGSQPIVQANSFESRFSAVK
jgi:hypothetical protein